MIYLDNAASSHPKPAEVIRAVTDQLRNNGANPGRSGHAMSNEAAQTVFAARLALANHFGAEPEHVIFTQNTTDAINRAFYGLLKDGDHVIVSDLEHNSVLRPLAELRKRNVTFSVAATDRWDGITVRNFEALIRPETKLIFCTHASNVTGQILPVEEIADLCRRKGILFGIDGAQTAGVLRYSLKESNADFLCIPGHKGLLGPQGTGALILSQNLPMEPLTQGGTGTHSLQEIQPRIYPEGYESGTLNTPGIAGLRAGVLFVDRYTDVIRKHETRLRERFLDKISSVPGIRVLGQGEQFVGTVSVILRDIPSEELARWLDGKGIAARGGFQCSALAHKTLGTEGTGALRISFGFRNTEWEVDECVKCLKNY